MKFSSTVGNFPFSAIVVLGLVLLSPGLSQAQSTQTVVSYTFAGTIGAPTSTAAGVSSSDFIRDSSASTFYDHTAGNPAPDANSNGWTTATVLNPALYYTFTVTPTASGISWNTLTLDVANFDAAQIDDGPTRFAVRSSLDGFTANLLTGPVGVTFSTDTVALNVTARTPVEYRIYGFGAGTTGGLFQIDNVALSFAAPVPEPSTLVGCGLAFGVGGILLARRGNLATARL